MKKWLNKRNWNQWVPLIEKHKKKLIVSFALVIVLFGIAGWRNSQWVMKVNGQKISKEEYEFYQKVYPNLTEEKLENRIVEDKVQLQQAKKRKIETIDDYSSIAKQMKKKNQEQEEKIKNKEVVYGLRSYDENSFYAYSLSISINELAKKTASNISDRQVKNYYNSHKKDFIAINSKELYRIQTTRKNLIQLKKGKFTEEQAAETPDCTYEKITLDESNLRDWIKYRNEELGSINELKSGTWSEVFERSQRAVGYYCISNEAGTIQPLSVVKEKIRIKLEKEKYQKNLKKWIEQAKVQSK